MTAATSISCGQRVEQEGLVPKDRPFADILQYNFDSLARWGRLYEMELIARYKLTRPNHVMDDARLGAKMFAKGKLSLLPPRGGDRTQMKRMVAEAARIEAERAVARGRVSKRPAPAGGAR